MNTSRHLHFGTDAQTLLRTALLGNAAFSSFSGFGLLLLPNNLIAVVGLPLLHIRIVLGCGLLGYAAWLGLIALKRTISLGDAQIAVCLDVAWTVLSIPVAIFSPLTTEGRWLVIAVATIVFLCAFLEWHGTQIIRSNGVETNRV